MLGMRIDIGTRNWLYRIKKWWAEGNRKFKVIKTEKWDWLYWKLKVSDYEDDTDRNIKTAKKYYIGVFDTLKYIQTDNACVKIGYWEGEPPRSITMNTKGDKDKGWKRLVSLYDLPFSCH